MWLAGNRHARAGQTGFTLFELLIAITLVAALTAVAVPVFTRSAGTEVKAAARTLAAGLRRTRSRAVLQGRAQVLALDVKRHAFRVGTAGRTRALPSDVTLQLFTARSELLGERAGAIRFYPDGSSTGGRITVTAGDRRLLVDVNWLSGRVRILGAG